MRVALYARVSSERQAEKDLSITSQLKALREFAEGKGWIVVKEFIDEAQSAKTADRPAFQEMVAMTKRESALFDAILVWNLSRFARNRRDSILYKWELKKRGVQVISISEQIDDTPAGKLLEGVLESVNEFYSELLAQDTIRGMKENAERGFFNGGNVPIGYKATVVMDGRNERKKLEIDEETAPLVRRIFRMALDGQGAKEIAKSLNSEGLRTNTGKPWCKNAVYWILNNEVYTGTYVWGKLSGRDGLDAARYRVRVEDAHPAIVDRETFEKVGEFLYQRSPKVTHPTSVSSQYLLSNILTCGKCGARMVGTAAKSSAYFYYTCQTYLRRGKEFCDAPRIRKEKIENLVLQGLRDAVLTEENLLALARMVREELANLRGEYEEELTTVEGQLDGLRERQERLLDALETGKVSVDMIAPRLQELRSQMTRLENTRAELLERVNGYGFEEPGVEEIREYADDLRSLLEEETAFQQKAFLRSFIRNITVNYPEVLLEYNFPLDGIGASSLHCPEWLPGQDSNLQPSG